MIIIPKTNSYEKLCNQIGVPYYREDLNKTLIESVLIKRDDFSKENELLRQDIDKLHQFMTSTFKVHQKSLVNQELLTRSEHQNSFSSSAFSPKQTIIQSIKIRNYQNEVKKSIKQYENIYIKYYKNFNHFTNILNKNMNLLDNIETFIQILKLCKRLYDYEGKTFLYEEFLIISSTSGIHIVYYTPLKLKNEEFYRNKLKEAIIKLFDRFFGKSIDLIIELYSIEQYETLNFDQLPENIKLEDLSYFMKILEQNSIDLTNFDDVSEEGRNFDY